MRTINLEDEEYVLVTWGLQLGLSTALKHRHPGADDLRDGLFVVLQKLHEEGGPVSNQDMIAAIRKIASRPKIDVRKPQDL